MKLGDFVVVVPRDAQLHRGLMARVRALHADKAFCEDESGDTRWLYRDELVTVRNWQAWVKRLNEPAEYVRAYPSVADNR